MLVRVVAEALKADRRLERALVDALLLDLLPARHLIVRLGALLVEVLYPVVVRAAFGELILEPEAVGNVGAHIVVAAALSRRLLRRGSDDDSGVILGVALRLQVHLLGAHRVGQKQVGILRGVGHDSIPHQDELALALIGEDLVSVVDVAMLVRQAVPRVVPDEFKVAAEFFSAHNSSVLRSHLVAMIDRIDPLVHGERCLDRVREGNLAHQVCRGLRFALASVGAGQADFPD